jgi:hypothetical protein
MTGILQKIIAGDSFRKTRFHDEQGAVVPLSEILYLPLRFVEALLARRNQYSRMPWWPVRAALRINELSGSTRNIVEFGSGMSTLWLADRFGHVTSVESNTEWHQRIAHKLAKYTNVQYLLRQSSEYLEIPPPLGQIDLVVIDGEHRARCIDWALAHLNVGAFIYLDNSDADKDHTGGRSRPRTFAARRKLLELQSEGIVSLEVFRGFPPANLVASEGFLAKIERISDKH